MRRPLIALTIALSAFVAAACTTASPGWTYAPPTPPPASQPAASGGASAAPSAAASAAPSGGASAAPSGGGAVQVSALNIAFEQKEVDAPADTAFTIAFDNKDSGVPHNVEIKDASGKQVFKGDIVTGPTQATYSVNALPAGTYQFVCSVHPNMTGTLKAGS